MRMNWGSRGALLAATLLTACGGGTGNNTGAASLPKDAGAAATPETTARGTAEANGIDCANRKETAGSRNDVLGVTIGMGAQEAYERLACANAAFTVEFAPGQGFRLPAVPGAPQPRTMLVADAGTEKVAVYLVGLPGEEKVYAISREVEFGVGAEPPVEQLYGTLVAKYGEGVRHRYYGDTVFTVAYSPSGQLLGADNEDFGTCKGDPHRAGVAADERCGLTVNYEIAPKPSNTGLAKVLFLTIVDQRGAMQAVEAYKAHAAGAVARKKEDELRQANDAVRNAAQGGRMPDL